MKASPETSQSRRHFLNSAVSASVGTALGYGLATRSALAQTIPEPAANGDRQEPRGTPQQAPAATPRHALPQASDDCLHLVDFAVDGEITAESIVQATEEAQGRTVIFPSNQTILLRSGSIARFSIPVCWRSGGNEGCTLKIDPEAATQAGPWMTFNDSFRCERIHFDGSDRQAKGLRFAPRPESHIILLDGSVHHWKQPIDETQQPTSGFAAGVESWGRYQHFYAERFDFHHCTADATIGKPRPNCRGINFSRGMHNSQRRWGEEGGPRLAEFHSCQIYRNHCGDYWGQGEIDADGIVWRNKPDGQSRCLIQNCSFWANAKRPIKIDTNSDECYIINCFFTEEALPNGGYTRYRNLAFQSSSGVIQGCVWDFPHARAFPAQAVVLINEQGMGQAIVSSNCRVRVRGEEAVKGSVFAVFNHGVPFTPDRVNHLSNWSINIPGGVDHLFWYRVNAYPTLEEAKNHGPRMMVTNSTVSQINDNVWYLEAREDQPGGGYLAAWLQNLVVFAGNTDPASVQQNRVRFELMPS